MDNFQRYQLAARVSACPEIAYAWLYTRAPLVKPAAFVASFFAMNLLT
jgi:hypothetical protein